jgi:hypothetical protein
MKRHFESAFVIVIIVLAIVIKEAVSVETKYVVVSGAIVLGAYFLHLVVQYWQRRALFRRLPWLFMLDIEPGINRIERYTKAESNVFIITPDLYNDARNSTTQSTVLSNLKRGVNYKYITRNDNDGARGHIIEVMYKFSSYSHLLEIYAINDLFGHVPACSILLIEHDETDKLRVFIELPVVEEAKRIWWVEADISVALQWHRKILDLLKQRQPLQNTFTKKTAHQVKSEDVN